MATTLDGEQTRIVRGLKREVRRRGRRGEAAFDTRRERVRAVRGGIATAKVESGIRNLKYGDADSQGWRQERASLYDDPTNVPKSIARFYDEWGQFADPGENAGQISAQVQRPAAQYAGRYGDEIRSGSVDQIRRAVRLKGGGSAAGGQGGQQGMRGLAAAMGFDPGMAAALGLGQKPLPPQALVPTSGPAAPAHAAQAVLPQGYGGGAVPSGGAPAPKQPSLASALQLVGQDVSFGGPEQLKGFGGRGPKKKGGRLPGTVEDLADHISRYAESELKLPRGSRDRSVGGNASVGGSSTSDHLEGAGVEKGGRGREGVDIPTSAANGGWGQYRKIARELGVKPADDGFTEQEIRVGKKRYRVQVIFGDAHGHGDHIHVGFKRID